MSLLYNSFQPCVLYNKITVDDGIGGYKTTWQEGVRFEASFLYDNGIEALTAQAQGVTSLVTITTRKSMNLQYHDVLKNLDTGMIFRVTTDGDLAKTPDSADLDMRQVRAEEWELTND